MSIFTDNFNRANGAIGGNWTNINGTFGISSNKATSLTLGADSRAQAVYSASFGPDSFGNDQYAQLVLADTTAYAGVVVRGSLSAYTGYVAVAAGTDSAISKFVAGTPTAVATGGPPFANGDVLRLEISGSTLTLKKNGVVVLTGTDSSISSGYAGIAGYNTTRIAGDNWEGGDLVIPTSLAYPLTIPITASKTRIGFTDVVGESVSPFSLKTQQYDWLADRLSIEMSFKPLKRVNASKMIAFLGGLRGKTGTFLAGDPMCRTPQGVATGTPVTNGASNQARSAFLASDGWTASVTGIIKAGDNLQITAPGGPQRLYIALEDANSNSFGQAVFQVFPRLRETIPDATTIVISNTKGTFRLSANQRQWDIETYLMANFTLSGVEAI